MKALYRRGEAYRGLGQLAPAASDLEHALRLSEGDAEQEAAIREKLDDVEEKMAQPACAEDGVVEELSAPGVRPCQNSAPKAGIIIEEITDDEVRGRKKCGDWKGVVASASLVLSWKWNPGLVCSALQVLQSKQLFLLISIQGVVTYTALAPPF